MIQWDRIEALVRDSGIAYDQIPDGAVNVRDWATHYRVTTRNASLQLERLVAEGRMQSGWGRSPTGRRIKFYWPKETTDESDLPPTPPGPVQA